MPARVIGQMPSLSTFLESIKTQDINMSVELLTSLLKRRQIVGSRRCAMATAKLLRHVVGKERWSDARSLINRIRTIGRQLMAAQPRELAVGNIVRRVLDVIREAAEDEVDEASQEIAPLFGLFQQSSSTTNLPTPKRDDLKAEVLESINLLVDEVEGADGEIIKRAVHQILPTDVILTYSSSQTVQTFLTAAAEKCKGAKFTVYHVELDFDEPTETDGQKGELWRSLTAVGVKVILVPDSHVFALMSRVTKVILSPHIVLANGSLVAASGTSTVVEAAKVYNVPVMVLTGTYKISPEFPFDPEQLIEYGDPSKIIPYQDGDFMDKVDVINPLYDHVEAEFIESYITDNGPRAPCDLRDIIEKHYNTLEDTDLTSAA